jgi:hypothetical protein
MLAGYPRPVSHEGTACPATAALSVSFHEPAIIRTSTHLKPWAPSTRNPTDGVRFSGLTLRSTGLQARAACGGESEQRIDCRRDRAQGPSRVVGDGARWSASPSSVVQDPPRSHADRPSPVGDFSRSPAEPSRQVLRSARSRASPSGLVCGLARSRGRGLEDRRRLRALASELTIGGRRRRTMTGEQRIAG